MRFINWFVIGSMLLCVAAQDSIKVAVKDSASTKIKAVNDSAKVVQNNLKKIITELKKPSQ
jgi:hypothetical protein